MSYYRLIEYKQILLKSKLKMRKRLLNNNFNSIKKILYKKSFYKQRIYLKKK